MTYRRETEGEGTDGYTRWIQPKPDRYGMACCDCGLVHIMQVRVVDSKYAEGHDPNDLPKRALPDPERYIVEFRMKRANRSTAMMRRHMKKKEKDANKGG